MYYAKNIVLTGGNSGVGYQSVKSLYEEGHHVIFGSRNEKKNKEAVNTIQEKQGGSLKAFPLDLQSKNSIEKFVQHVKNHFSHVDILVNNAGLAVDKREITEIGIEKTLTINHFGHFYLTYLLWSTITKSKEGRIINVSSKAHFRANEEQMFNLTSSDEKYGTMKQYEISKLYNVLFTVGLRNLLEQKKLSYIKTACLHPGVVATNIWSVNSLALCCSKICCCCCMNQQEGSRTILHLCRTSFESIQSGEYYDSDTSILEMSELARDPALVKRLWLQSEKAYQLKFD